MPARPRDRVFHAPAPNVLWVSDFTYVSTWSGCVYVAFVIDVYARRIVGLAGFKNGACELHSGCAGAGSA